MKNSAARPPQRLSAEARKAWRKLADEYGIADDAGLLILNTAFEAFDRMREAQAGIEKEGSTIVDRFGQLKAHPLLPVERDARAAFLSALKSLNLDVEPLNPLPGRPPGGSKSTGTR
ncbi:MAG: P27 family phage terminase small subunit [Geminicoccaceae bacterium]